MTCTIAVTLNDGIMRSIDVMICGKHTSVCGYGEDFAPLSVVLVFVCYPPNVARSGPFRRPFKIGAVDSDSGYTILRQFTELFDRISHIFHVKVDLGF